MERNAENRFGGGGTTPIISVVIQNYKRSPHTATDPVKKILTISIAAYNSEKYLVKCLDSFACCKEIDKLEVLVINDGSTDKTRQIAEEYQARFPGSITVINKENGGHGSTINCSLKLATGKYFKLVDADDSVDSEGLDKLVRFLEDVTTDLILNPYVTITPIGEITKTISCVRGRIEYGKEYEFCEIENAIVFAMHTSTFRTDIVKQIRQPITDQCFYVDNEYILYSIPHVKNAILLDYVVYKYLLGIPEQSVSPKNRIMRRDERLRVTKNAIQYYYSFDRDTNGLELIRNRVLRMIRGQYLIYFSMRDTKTGKEEVIRFDNWLKEECSDLYADLHTVGRMRSRLFFRFLRMTNFHGFRFLVALLHVLGMGG